MSRYRVDPAEERARLIEMADEYLAALRSREPGGLPLSPRFRATQDTQPLALGTGIWRTVRGMEEGGHYFADVERGEVEYWGVMDEMGEPAILSVRLRVEAQRFLEAETIVTRKGPFFDPDRVLEENVDFHRVLGPEDRASRAELIRAADLYFDGIEQQDGSRVRVEDDCRRLVNGAVDSVDDEENLIAGEEHRALGVARQIDEGYYAYIEALRDRRYPIVDEERGLVVCHLVFDHPGDRLRAGRDLPIKSPGSMVFTEVFKVVAGTIEEIWALGTASLPYGSGSGW
jgi:hypothetical protein